ncbi:MAG: SMI1/KNR4 family protein [Candidatus Desantisbacteria bacterium]
METCNKIEECEERKEQIEALSTLLDTELPESYKHFLIELGSTEVNGLPLLGLPISADLSSVWGATECLRSARPDLAPAFLAIRFMDSCALCLDLMNGIKDDAPLVEVDLEGSEPPRTVHNSFRRYLEEGNRNKRRVMEALRRIEYHLKTASKNKRYEHNFVGTKPPYKMRDWRVMRSCVHDQVVGFTVIRYDEEFNGLEVDVFICTDHPNYQPGHGVQALTLLLLSDAYRNGGSMEIRFTRHDSKAGGRVPDRIPPELLILASEFGIVFCQGKEGIITHDEAVKLYSFIIGFSIEVRKAIDRYQTEDRLTLQGLCYLLSTRIWTVEEASWVLLNFPRPEGVLFGADLPEDRLSYLESVSYGRSALLATKLYNRLKINAQGNDRECLVSVNNLTWLFKTIRNVTLDWEVSGRSLSFTPGEIIEVLSSPRGVSPEEISYIVDDVKMFLSHSKQKTRKFLLYSSDFRDIKGANEIAKQVEEKTGISILIAPFKCRELDYEVERRMSRGRILRA